MARIFRPIRGKDIAIRKIPIQDGNVYFAYDTGFIYLDKLDTRYTLGGRGTGGGSNILFATAEEDVTLFKKDELSDLDPYWSMSLSALEGYDPEITNYPPDDTIIINSDGRFFRVIGSDANAGLIELILIATGGGVGGGGSGTGSGKDLSLLVDSSTIKDGNTYVYGKKSFIKVTGSAINGNPDPEVTLSFDIKDNQHDVEYHYSATSLSGRVYNFDTSVLPLSEDLTITIGISSTNTSLKPKDRPSKIVENIKVVEMYLTKPANMSNFIPLTSYDAVSDLLLSYVPHGENLICDLHASVDSIEISIPHTTITPQQMGRTMSIEIPKQSHGVHQVELWISTTPVGSDTTVDSDHITYQAAWTEADNNTPLIWLGDYNSLVINYENQVIPFMIYDPASQATNSSVLVRFLQNGAPLDLTMELTYNNNTWYEWDLTALYTVGENNFAIQLTSGSYSTQVQISFTVTTEGSRDLDLINKTALLMNFTSTGRSNQESASKRNVWVSGSYKASFSNFNWYNNGWMNDNDGEGSYLSIANGSSISIPCPTLALNSQDYSIEIRFRVKNIQAYSTLVTTDPHYYFANEATPYKQNGHSGTLKDLDDHNKQSPQEKWTVALDEDGNLLMDRENTVKVVKKTDEEGIALKLLSSDGNVGICVGTQEAYFNTGRNVTSVRYKEDEIITLSLVVDAKKHLALIYLNGILSGATELGNNTITFEPHTIDANSLTCDFDLYKIRIYQYALTMPEVIHNYISDIHSIILYDQNQLTRENEPTKLSLAKIKAYNQEQLAENNRAGLTMPYAIIEIIDNTETHPGMHTPEGGSYSHDKLPYYKGNNRYSKITFVNPSLDAAWEAKEIDDDFYLSHCPSFEAIGADINVQGTSSQQYPRRNYKTKMKSAVNQTDSDKQKHEDWGWRYTNGPKKGETFKKWKMDNTNYATNKFTWKIDYMESSGSYNTGFANLASTLYSQHPLDTYEGLSVDTAGLRTSIYGFPVLVFHQHSTAADVDKLGTEREDEIYEYIGRYNLNLDKGSNEYYGFEDDNEQIFVSNDDGSHPKIADVAECWELTDNQGSWTSFVYPNDEARKNGFGTYTAASYTEPGVLGSNPKLEVLNHFEYRYNKDEDQLDAAMDYQGGISADFPEFTSFDTVNTWLKKKFSNLEKVFNWLDSTNQSAATNSLLSEPVVVDTTTEIKEGPSEGSSEWTSSVKKENGSSYTTTFKNDTAQYRLNKFTREFTDHFNREYCEIYFVLTELLLAYDSRGKNMMLASFGPQKVGGEYIWFPIFYDIDTQLGLNNIGATLWDYDTDASASNTFSTPNSTLWVNFLQAFGDSIKTRYYNLRKSGKLTYENIEGAYLCDPNVFNSYAMRGIRPTIAIGLDEYYKYIEPTISGYVDTAGETKFDANYWYAINGDRKLSRQLFLRNRLNYIDSYWQAGTYSSEQNASSGIALRINANDDKNTSDKYKDSDKYPIPYFDGTPVFTLKPFLNQYVFVYFDDTPSGAPVKYVGLPVETQVAEDVIAGYKTTQQNEQIVYIPGGEYLSSMGDLSIKYLSQIQLRNGQRLLDLTIGSDIPGYVNNLLTEGGKINFDDSAKDSSGRPNPNAKALLQKIILTNLASLAESFDLTGSQKLRECRALNTQIKAIDFAEGAPLDTIHLPWSITTLKLVEARNLNKILIEAPVICTKKSDVDTEFEYEFTNPETYKGLYLEGITDKENYKGGKTPVLSSLTIAGGSLGYASYILLKNIFDIKEEQATEGQRLKLSYTGVNWSPYTNIDDNEYHEEQTYYTVTDHNTFTQYTYTTPEDWQIQIANNRIFTYDESAAKDTIKNLELLDAFIEDYEDASGKNVLNHYTNTAGGTKAAYPEITGNLYVQNTEDTQIDEADIGNKYKKAFPNLNIYVANVKESYVAKYINRENNVDTVIDIFRYSKDGDSVKPGMTDKIAARSNYDFIGWATDPNGVHMVASYTEDGGIKTNEEFNKLQFSEVQTIFVFYAIFKIHSYKMTFDFDNSQPPIVLYQEWSMEQGIEEPHEIPWKPYNLADTDTTPSGELALYRKFKFVGWARKVAPDMLVDLKTLLPNRDYEFIATYEDISVYDDILDSKYLDLTRLKIDHSIKLNPDYYLAGKITLPTVIDGEPVYMIGENGFNHSTINNGITHIFWARENRQLKQIAFSGMQGGSYIQQGDSEQYKEYPPTLVYFEMPNSCTTAKGAAFLGQTLLGSTDDNEGSGIAQLLKPLTTLNENSFYSLESVKKLVITGESKKTSGQVFGGLLNLQEVIFGSQDEPSKQKKDDIGLVYESSGAIPGLFGGEGGNTGGNVEGGVKVTVYARDMDCTQEDFMTRLGFNPMYLGTVTWIT